MDAIAALREEIARLDAETASLRGRIERNMVARHALVEFLRRLSPDGPHKVGPTQAVRDTLKLNPGLTRRELLDAAKVLVTTTPREKIEKTVRQTILNMIHHGLFE